MDSPQPEKPDISSWPRVTAILQATGVSDFSKIPNAEFYLQRGSDVHLVCESIAKREPDWWSDGELAGYAAAWQKFLEETSFRPKLIEQPVYNEQRRYKGTLDYVGTFGDAKDIILLDLKSGIVAEWVKLQTAAYAACLENPERIRRYGVQLKKNGTYAVSPEFKDYRTDANYFFSLVATIHGRTLYGKTEILEDA